MKSDSQEKRIAFITTQYVTSSPTVGGLARYLLRMSEALVREGVQIEIFVVSDGIKEEVLEKPGLIVRHVPVWRSKFARALVQRVSKWLGLGPGLTLVCAARRARLILEAREKDVRFTLVQAADYEAIGLLLKRKPCRPIVVRCSSAVDLYQNADARKGLSFLFERYLTIRSIRRADRSYAPSKLTAEHLNDEFGLDLAVLRPPLQFETYTPRAVPLGIPKKFLLHFGQLIPRKGTDFLLAAFSKALQLEPEMNLVLVGVTKGDWVSGEIHRRGLGRSRLLVMHAMSGPEVYAIIQRAQAVVVPSRIDNYPNVAIESLLLGTPVIGTQGTSLEELVTSPEQGTLVSLADENGLAEAMVLHWRKADFARTPLIGTSSAGPGSSVFQELTSLVAGKSLY